MYYPKRPQDHDPRAENYEPGHSSATSEWASRRRRYQNPSPPPTKKVRWARVLSLVNILIVMVIFIIFKDKLVMDRPGSGQVPGGTLTGYARVAPGWEVDVSLRPARESEISETETEVEDQEIAVRLAVRFTNATDKKRWLQLGGAKPQFPAGGGERLGWKLVFQAGDQTHRSWGLPLHMEELSPRSQYDFKRVLRLPVPREQYLERRDLTGKGLILLLRAGDSDNLTQIRLPLDRMRSASSL